MGKRTGRPRMTRPRRKDGRLIPLIDKGNIQVQQRREAFQVFQGGKAGDQLGDAIGRAWAAGLLDGQGVDAAILRDVGRRYANVHRSVFSETQTKVARFERGCGGAGGTVQADLRDLASYTALDALAASSGAKNRLAMRKLCVECSVDENPAWLQRLIAEETWGANAKDLGTKRAPDTWAYPRDRMILAQATAALVAMVSG